MENSKIITLTKDETFRFFANKNLNFITNQEGLFSMTPTDQAQFVVEIMQRYYPLSMLKNMIITESNGGFGGNTYEFLKIFKLINFVEINKQHVDIFKHNLDEIKKVIEVNDDKLTIYNKDYSQIFGTLKQDIIFMDPPWGGVDYRKENNLRLYFGNLDINDIISELIVTQPKLKMILIKAPENFILNLTKNVKKADVEEFNLYKQIPKTSIKKVLYKIIVVSKSIPINTSIPTNNIFQPVMYKQLLDKYFK
jgi:16S rRNA G966 N2-methylase RsmD